MDLTQIHLAETTYGKGFKGNLEDLLRDVFQAGQQNPEADFEDNEYAKINIASITVGD